MNFVYLDILSLSVGNKFLALGNEIFFAVILMFSVCDYFLSVHKLKHIISESSGAKLISLFFHINLGNVYSKYKETTIFFLLLLKTL